MSNVRNSVCIILWTCILFCTGDRVKLSFACPVLCSCFTESGSLITSVKCNFGGVDPENYSSLFPFVLPINTSIVELQQVAGPLIFDLAAFVDPSWHAVQELTINDSSAKDSYVSNNSLHGLDNLKVLRMHLFIGSLESGVFLHTPDVETLDLSDNPFLGFEYVSTALHYAMPNLRYLDLTRIQRRTEDPIVLGTKFTESIRTKPLEILNVSETNLAMFDSSFNYSSIQVLNISRNSLQWISRDPNHEWFPNLRELDISHSTLPLLLELNVRPNVVLDLDKTCFIFLRSLRYLYAHDIEFRFLLRIQNGYISASCGSVLEFIDISNLNLRWLNFSTSLDLLHLKTLIVSRNALEYISPNLFRSFQKMSKLRLQHNNLGTMQYFPHFEDIFSKNEALEILDVSWNSLSFLPRKLFAFLSNLKELNLQGNRIVHFDIEIRDLHNLRTLDLSENGLTLISSDVIHDLDTINSMRFDIFISNNASSIIFYYGLNETSTNTVPLQRDHAALVINLQGSKFDCSCEHVSFLKWITESKIHFEGSSKYKCGPGLYIQEPDKDSIHNLVNYCNLQRNLPVIIVPIIIGCLLIPCFVLLTLYIRRKTRLGKLRRNYVNDYAKFENEMVELKDKTYPAFLSFCSDDNDVAKNYFYPTLVSALKKYFGDKEVLVLGETIFRPGKIITSEIEYVISRSDVIIFLVTIDFIKSKWCRLELNQANLEGKPTIYLVENTVLKGQLPPCLRKIKTHTRATWTRVENDIKITPDWDVIAGQVLDFAAAVKQENRLKKFVHNSV